MTPLVRLAGPGDHAQACLLDAEARAGLLDQRGGPVWLAEHAPLPEHQLGDDAVLLVGVIDDVVVGFAVLERRATAAVVERVYVTPAARGLGFGDDLLAAALDTARAWGSAAIEAEALPGDRDTKNLYERAGITARKITVWRALGPGER